MAFGVKSGCDERLSLRTGMATNIRRWPLTFNVPSKSLASAAGKRRWVKLWVGAQQRTNTAAEEISKCPAIHNPPKKTNSLDTFGACDNVKLPPNCCCCCLSATLFLFVLPEIALADCFHLLIIGGHDRWLASMGINFKWQLKRD